MKKLKIALSGYGKMGREVERTAISRHHDVVARLDNMQDWKRFTDSKTKVEVVIDFSMPSVALDVFATCFNLGIPLVTGTTGWYDHKSMVFKMADEKQASFFYAPNFSIGVNLFFYINRKLAGLMNTVSGYDVSITETHHIHKLDAPSGTAIKAASDIIDETENLTGWSPELKQSGKLPIYSIREGEVTRTHEIVWQSDADEIILKHIAKNRSGFALGAVMAAEYIQGKKGIFTMENMLDLKSH